MEPGTYAHVDGEGRLDGVMPATITVVEDGVPVEKPNVTEGDVENGWFRWELQAEPPDDFWNYLLVDGALVRSEKTVIETASAGEVLAALFAAEPAMMQGIPDGTLSRMAAYMVAWEIGETYETGDLRQHERFPYRCEQDHTSQQGWEPPNVPALWTRIGKPGEVPEWVQPTGAQDAYQHGDHVMHNGAEWVSTYDGPNVWEPGVYGWELVEGGE